MSNERDEVELRVEGVNKTFGSVHAVRDCHLTVRRGEMVALLGPSGCGKTTLLNVIAGFESCNSGDLWLRGVSLRDIPPNHRNIGIVFQSYALFPHMTTAGNIGYGLRIRRAPSRVIRERVAEVIDLLKLNGLENRYPSELSGGQQQRVAVARALAVRPVMLLLDEALSALDKNLREQMQVELSILLRQLGITTIIVTHDQREAFTIADRIAVMSDGQILQIGTPQEIYSDPKSSFVLEFVGSANVLKGIIDTVGSEIVVRADCGLTMPAPEALPLNLGERVNIYVRAEDIVLSSSPTPVHKSDPGIVSLARFMGATQRHAIDLGSEQVVLDSRSSEASAQFKVGNRVFIDIAPERCYVLPASQVS
ncbi:MAG: ABC transporter ATP-binding protein [Rhodospirillaceae bacterium]|nr:ABC transporter ATP-binding protein [Rhodospirillaceae bacterium]